MTSFFPVYDGEPIVTLIVPTLRVFFLYVSLNVTITFLVPVKFLIFLIFPVEVKDNILGFDEVTVYFAFLFLKAIF